MKRFVWPLLAVSSVFVALASAAQTRPQYGGTLHVDLHIAPTTLDPSDRTQPDSFARRNLTFLIFDTLVISDGGRLRPGLAQKWQASPGNRRWQFQLRPGVRLHDGSLLRPDAVAASLRASNPSWNISIDGESITIECETPDPELATEVALARNAILLRATSGPPVGTGPFHVVDWQPGKKLSLAAEENYWGGRPFLDAIEIEFGRSYRDQTIALELGRADLVEIAPEQARRTSDQNHLASSSAPIELLALVFAHEAKTDEENFLRDALGLSIDRASMHSVLLQATGKQAGSILPAWMSGYGFVFSTEVDLARARHLREQVRSVPAWTLGYDADDPVCRLLAERVALNARDAGLVLQPTSAVSSDLRVARIPMASMNAWISLNHVAGRLGLAAPKETTGSAEDLYAAEQSLLAANRVIPLFHLPVTYASTGRLKGWSVQNDGRWNLTDSWLESAKP